MGGGAYLGGAKAPGLDIWSVDRLDTYVTKSYVQ
jgi:hypothetical protein